MNEIESKLMTTKELAEMLGVSTDSIQNTVKKLGENFRRVIKTNSQGGYLFNEVQATAIKLELQNHSKVNFASPKTELEENLLVEQAMNILHKKIKILTERAIKAESTNAILMHINKTYTATEVAKEIGLRSAEELNRYLEKNGIQFKQNGTWLPKADFADCGYFEIKQGITDNGYVYYDRKITQLGREFILKLYEKNKGILA